MLLNIEAMASNGNAPETIEDVEAAFDAFVMAAVDDHEAWCALVDDVGQHVHETLDGSTGQPLQSAFVRVVMAKALLKGADALRTKQDSRADWCQQTAMLLLSYSLSDFNSLGDQIDAMSGWLASYEKSRPGSNGIH